MYIHVYIYTIDSGGIDVPTDTHTNCPLVTSLPLFHFSLSPSFSLSLFVSLSLSFSRFTGYISKYAVMVTLRWILTCKKST